MINLLLSWARPWSKEEWLTRFLVVSGGRIQPSLGLELIWVVEILFAVGYGPDMSRNLGLQRLVLASSTV